MSKYTDELFDRHKDVKNLKELTKQIQADHNISKCLKFLKESEDRIKIRKEIQKMLKGL